MMPKSLLQFPLVLLMCWACTFHVLGQHNSWQQFTTDDGLPDNQVYNVLQDSRGYLWFVTNQGICRFNGYEFHSPIDTSKYAGSEAYVPFEDSAGIIWFARLDATIWYIENDSIRPWKWNHVIDQYRSKDFRIIDQLGMDNNGAIWMAVNALGFLKITNDSTSMCLRFSDHQNFVATKFNDKLIYAFQGPLKSEDGYKLNQKNETEIFYIADEVFQWPSITYDVLHPAFFKGIWEVGDKEYVLDAGGTIFYFSDGRVLWSDKRNMLSEKIIRLKDGSIMAASHAFPNPGLFRYRTREDFKNGHSENLLEGQKVTDIFVDREGGWWATTHNAGIFYCKNPDALIYDQSNGFPANEIRRLAYDQEENLYLGFKNGEVWTINVDKDDIYDTKAPSLSTSELWDLKYEPSSHHLWRTPPLMYMNEKEKWIMANWNDPNTTFNNELLAKSVSFDSSGQFLYGTLSGGFYQIDAWKQKVNQLGIRNNNLKGDRTFSILPQDENHLWVTTRDGLQWWEEDRFTSVPFEHPALKLHPRELVALPGGGMVIGLRGGGILIRDAAGNLTHLTTKDGLTSDILNTIQVSTDGKILVSTNEGLNIISQQEHRWQIRTITEKHGLPSNVVNDAVILNGEVWAGTDKGLARFSALPETYTVPSPTIEEVSINNHPSQNLSTADFSHTQNNITIRYFSTHYKSVGDIIYRYHLIGADTNFIQTKERTVNYAKLAPGSYHFEVQAKNEDGSWSAATTWKFRIHSPWWQTWWFYLLVALIIYLLAWIIQTYRIRSIKEKSRTETKIKELELSALRAQMNPHFIFNCLASIQQFIVENEKETATRYLAKFARLVRLSLHSSVDGRHSLSEEIEMLDNYLALEQMRFKNKFEYSISHSGVEDADEIMIPPLLVQPFVENSIIHGMKNLDQQGKISISFSMQGSKVMVTVEDNGGGILEDPFPQNGHKSIGMVLTKKRLETISPKAEAFNIENILENGEGSRVLGTRVSLIIQSEV